MKYLLVLLLFIVNYLNASDYELKLYENVLGSVFSEKVIYIYSSEDELSELIDSSIILKRVDSCIEATVLMEKKSIDECNDKPLFATSYKTYKNKKNAFGVFYWRKGRPQLKLNLKAMHKFNLSLPKNLQSYAY